jgi:hypothetical protein
LNYRGSKIHYTGVPIKSYFMGQFDGGVLSTELLGLMCIFYLHFATILA